MSATLPAEPEPEHPGAPPAAPGPEHPGASRGRWRRAALALAIALPCLGLVELALHVFFARRPPRPEDWVAARPRVEALKKPGDLLLIAPRWLDPHARMHLGPELLPLRDLARPDETRYPRALVLRSLGQDAPEVAGWKELHREPLARSLEAVLLENPAPVPVLRDLVDEVDAGRVEVAWVFPDREVPCPWQEQQRTAATGLFSHPTMPPGRHVCGGAPWQSVGVTVHDDEGFRPRRCIWTPPPQGGHVRLRFPAGASGATLRGHGSIHWTLEREQRGGPVFLEWWLDGVLLGTVKHEDGQGWAPFELPLGERGREGARIEARIHAPDARERHFCWEASLRP